MKMNVFFVCTQKTPFKTLTNKQATRTGTAQTSGDRLIQGARLPTPEGSRVTSYFSTKDPFVFFSCCGSIQPTG